MVSGKFTQLQAKNVMCSWFGNPTLKLICVYVSMFVNTEYQMDNATDDIISGLLLTLEVQ